MQVRPSNSSTRRGPRLRRLGPAAVVAAGLVALLVPTGTPAQAVGPAVPAAVPTTAVRARAAAAAVPAGTIVFIKANNVWIERPDGSAARALTKNGTAALPYSSPSQDDAGHVVALHTVRKGGGSATAAEVLRLDQSGHVLSRFAPPVPALGTDFAEVSPDGTTIAFSFAEGGTDCNFTPCHTFFVHTLAYADATRSHLRAGTKTVSDVLHATWVGNSRVLLERRPPNVVALHRPASTTATTWFTDCLSATPGCDDTNQYHYAPAASRRGDRYADIGVTNVWGADHTSTALVIRSAVGVATATTPGAPGAGCSFPGLDVSGDLSPDELTRATLPLSGPSWSPDGRSVVYALRGASGWAVFRIDVPADTADCDAYDGANIAAGGSQPQWSPAPLAAVVATPKAPKGWHLKRVTSKRLLDKTLHAKKSADVRLPKKYIGGLLQVTTRAATKRTKLSVCAKPAHGTAAGTRCAKVVAKKRATRTVSVIATAGAGHHVRVRNAKGKVRVTVTVLGYYRR